MYCSAALSYHPGIRVDKEALQRQLKQEGEEKRLELYFHKRLMNDTLPLSIGGGIGQSRLLYVLFKKSSYRRNSSQYLARNMREECRTQYLLDLILRYK